MSRSLTSMYGTTLAALDGHIGVVKDFYFEDEHWIIRHVIVDTGSWLSDRKVLIAPRAIHPMRPGERHFTVDLTKEQIENCPSIDVHKPVSRQYEEDVYRYYGWPYYWQGMGVGLWNLNAVAQSDGKDSIVVEDGVRLSASLDKSEDRHLRSTLAVDGYAVQASDGPIGHVADFHLAHDSWRISSLDLTSGPWHHARRLRLGTSHIRSISYETSSMQVDLTLAQIRQGIDDHGVFRIATPAPVPQAVAPAVSSAGTSAGTLAVAPAPSATAPSSEQIAHAAYDSYVAAGRQPGHDVQHWLAAEARLRQGAPIAVA